MSITQELLDDINDDPDLLKRIIMDMKYEYTDKTSKLSLNHPSGGILYRQDQKNSPSTVQCSSSEHIKKYYLYISGH